MMTTDQETRSAYQAPAVIYEAELEVRAGSPLNLIDPFGLGDPTQAK